MSWKLNVTQHKSLSQSTGPSLFDRSWKYTSYENEINIVELNKSSNFHTDLKPGISCTAKLYKYWNRSKVVTSGVTTSGLFHGFCFSDKLQNYSEAGQSLRYSIAFDHKFVAVLQSEI